MNIRRLFCYVSAVIMVGLPCATAASASGGSADDADAEGAIFLVVRGDDIGSSHAANLACIRASKQGIAKSLEVMVPAPWFNEAARMLRENPGIDVGVHLTLTSEWESMKWGPLTDAPSLVDEQGHFYPMTSQRSDFPPGTGFLQAEPRLEEVEKELRAQIELALKMIPNVSHLTSHMGTPTCTPQLKAVVEKLSKQYKLPLGAPSDVRYVRGFSGETAEEKESSLVKALEGLTPGRWLLVEHPGLDTPEMQAIGHIGYRNVAADRDGVTKAFTSDKVKKVLSEKKIRLISYRDLWSD